MHPEGLRPGAAPCDLCFILSHNTKPKELKKKKLLLLGICCDVHVNTELLSCPVHLVLFNSSFSSVWLFDSLKFLLLLPVLTMQEDNDLFVNVFPFQARLAPEHKHHLSQQEIFAPKYPAGRWYWLHWKYLTEPQLWKSAGGLGELHIRSQPSINPLFFWAPREGGHQSVNGHISPRAEGRLWTWPWQELPSRTFGAPRDF